MTAQNTNAICDGVEVIFLAWWPKIVLDYIVDAPNVGVANFHPTFLPYDRGKNYVFWRLVEGTSFGVTLHFVDEGIDSGDIAFQVNHYSKVSSKHLILNAGVSLVDIDEEAH